MKSINFKEWKIKVTSKVAKKLEQDIDSLFTVAKLLGYKIGVKSGQKKKHKVIQTLFIRQDQSIILDIYIDRFSRVHKVLYKHLIHFGQDKFKQLEDNIDASQDLQQKIQMAQRAL